MTSEANSELESFRRKWQEEVSRRRDVQPKTPVRTQPKHTRTSSRDLASHFGGPSNGGPLHEDDVAYGTYDFDDMEAHDESKKVGSSDKGPRIDLIANRDPVSALDHYEMAVVRETEGKLGESLDLYRKAFRLDDCVDQIYKRKHFPASSFKTKSTQIRSTSPTAKAKENPKISSTVSALVASFADAPITGASPIISGDIPPPCPIKNLPGELLIEVLDAIAHIDVAVLSRLAQVSKRFAYLVATQETIWKHLIHGPKYGLGGMHYSYAREISGQPLELSLADLTLNQADRAPRTLPMTLPLSPAYPTYRHMFQHRPRLRFSGVYISTVNYTRPGASGPNTLTWNTPIHVVTYYRYLRFYRDGTAISLLTTTEPLDVVPYLKKDNIGLDSLATTTLPVGVMRDARRARWKLASSAELLAHEAKKDVPDEDPPDEDVKPPTGESSSETSASKDLPAATSTLASTSSPPDIEPEGILTIETEGPTAAYQYTARFELQSSGKGASARNTKLAWRGFWSYNVISGDWGEFRLKNDKAFVWSRVRSWADA